MAKVEILVDSEKLSRKPMDFDVQSSTGVAELWQLRERIRKHLGEAESPTLRVRLDDVRYRKLADLDGMGDLTVVHVTPRSELAATTGEQIPYWCDSATIVELGLLTAPVPAPQAWSGQPCDLKLLSLLNPRLVAQDIEPEELLFLLYQSGKKISTLLASEIIIQHFSAILGKKVEPAGIPLLFECLTCANYSVQLETLFRQIFQEKIKGFTTVHGLPWTFDARHFPDEITDRLTLTNAWWQVIHPDAKLGQLTDLVLLKVNKGVMLPARLAEIIWTYSKVQLDKIAIAVRQNPRLATQELLAVVSALSRPETADLERSIADLLEVVSPGLLLPESTVKQALEWANRYLAHARSAFRREEEPNTDVSGSFSDWVDAQAHRITMSDHNWRTVATTVKGGLERGSDVILLVIDAFGAIVSDRLLQRLQSAIDWQISSQSLFGPLPTITEVAKMAVASGLDVAQLPSDKEQALRNAYRDVLSEASAVQFSSSWKDVNITMQDAARLMVVFENQFDEQVHQCTTHADLHAQLEVVCTKVSNSIQRWIKEAELRDRALEIYITADHGMARIVSAVDVPPLPSVRTVKERCIEVGASVTQAPADCYLVTPEGNGKSKYIVPRDRVKFSKGIERFVHGGLCPEEVLIPLIAIRRSENIQAQEVLVTAEPGEVHTNGQGWTLALKVTAGATHLRRVQISCEAPFTGSCMVEHVAGHQSKLLTMHIHSTVAQEGWVNIGLKVAHVLIGGTGFQESQQTISVNLRPHIFIREQGAADFDNMFD
jgi:hypothetical protein